MVNQIGILTKTLVIGAIILFIGATFAQSTAIIINDNISTKYELPLTSYKNRKIIEKSNEPVNYIQNNLKMQNELKNQPFENIAQGKKHKNIEDFKGNSWILYPTDDTFIEKIFPDENYGSLNLFKVGRNGNGYLEEDGLIKFDISSVPSGTFVYAKLYLYYYEYDEEPNDREYNIYRITSDWDEDNVTWNKQPSYVFTPTDILIVPDNPGVWLEFDVTEDVQGFIEGQLINYGWIISDDDDYFPQGQREAHFLSKENGDFIPYLLVKEPATIYVDDDNVNGPWDGTEEYPFMKIQDGIDNCFSGDSIYVYNGTYYESVLIYEEHISLIGESKDDTIIINEKKQYVVLIRNRYYGITISGFTIQTASNNEYGYAGIALDIYSYDNYISENIIADNKVGIILWSSHYNFVLNNTISDNIGIILKGGNNHNIISNNEIIDVVNGISLEEYSSYNIVNNNAISNAEIGISLNGYSQDNFVNNNIVSNTENGIYIDDHLNNNISYNLLENNNNGIYAHMSKGNISLIRNTIIENRNGIYLDIDIYGNISGNLIESNSCGIYCSGGEYYNQLYIYNNNITNNKNLGGLFTNRAINCEIFCNNFINNKPNARFVTLFGQEFGSNKNQWYNNYWDNLKDSSYRIFGRIGFVLCIFPWFQFDQHPVIEPYDI